MFLALLEDAVDSAGGGVLFVAEGARVVEFVAAARGLLLFLDERGRGRPGRGEGHALTLGCAPIGPNLIHSPRGQDMITLHRDSAPHCFDVSCGLKRNLDMKLVPLES
jgi:hypothetical protein